VEVELLRLGGVIILGVVAIVGLGPIGRGLAARLRGTDSERRLQHLEDRIARLEAEIDSQALLSDAERERLESRSGPLP
jgi:S-adenosylhomocysteine hydrolase